MKVDKNELPLLVKNSIKAICDENRQKILIFLNNNGSKSFIEISKKLKMPKNTLSHHIKKLMLSGLLYNHYVRNEFTGKYSFYEVSKLGKRFLESLLNFMKPHKQVKEDIISLDTEKSFDVFDEVMLKTMGEERRSDSIISVSASNILPTLAFTAETGVLDERSKSFSIQKTVEPLWCGE